METIKDLIKGAMVRHQKKVIDAIIAKGGHLLDVGKMEVDVTEKNDGVSIKITQEIKVISPKS